MASAGGPEEGEPWTWVTPLAPFSPQPGAPTSTTCPGHRLPPSWTARGLECWLPGVGDVRTRSQAPGTRARVGPLGPPGGLLPGSPARRGLTLRRPTCHLCSPTGKPRRPHGTATLLSPSDWGSGARAPHACPHALCSGSGRRAAASDPGEARGAETAFPGAVGARVGAARRVCGPDVSPSATSTSQMTTVGRRRPSSLRGHNPKSQATAGLLPTKRVCDTGPDTHREHLACSSGRRLGHVNRPLPVKTGIKHTPLGHRRLWPHPPGPRLRAGQRRDSTRESGLLFTAAARGRPHPCWAGTSVGSVQSQDPQPG